MYSSHTTELILGGGPPTAAFVAPSQLCCIIQSLLCGGSNLCRIFQIQVVDS